MKRLKKAESSIIIITILTLFSYKMEHRQNSLNIIRYNVNLSQ